MVKLRRLSRKHLRLSDVSEHVEDAHFTFFRVLAILFYVDIGLNGVLLDRSDYVILIIATVKDVGDLLGAKALLSGGVALQTGGLVKLLTGLVLDGLHVVFQIELRDTGHVGLREHRREGQVHDLLLWWAMIENVDL